MDEIDSLRQQLHAAEFLVTSLQSRLVRAEARYDAANQYHDSRVAQSGTDEGTTHHEQRCAQIDGSQKVQHQHVNDTVTQSQTTCREQVELRQAPRPYPQGHLQQTEPDEQHSGGLPNVHDEARVDDQEDDEDEPSQTTEPSEYSIPAGMALPNVSVKTIFPDLGTVKAAIEAYALAQGWTPATKKRDRLRICMGCRTAPNCTFHVRAETCAEGARISASKMAHTCQNAVAGGGVPKRHHVASLRFLRQEVPKFMEITRATPTKDIQDAVRERFGTKISLAQCSKLRGRVREKKSCQQGCSKCGGHGHNRLTCPSVARTSLAGG